VFDEADRPAGELSESNLQQALEKNATMISNATQSVRVVMIKSFRSGMAMLPDKNRQKRT
jgi:hypothetical protein